MLKIEQILRNENGDNVLGESFEQIQFKNEFIIVKKEGLKGLYRMNDYKKILLPEWDRITFDRKYIFPEKQSQVALFDSDGKEILQCEWDKIVLYENGILVSREKCQGFYSYTGKLILKCCWRRIEPYAKLILAFKGDGTKRTIFDYNGVQLKN